MADLLFDLDGTLTDSGPGILNCATLALEHFGIPVPDRQTLRVFVGPPIRDTFRRFGVPEERLEEAVEVFRGRYQTVGKFENTPYPGIPQLLERLTAQGHRLYVATSKPEVTALEILDKFGLGSYFTEICGAAMDGSRDEKAEVIAYLFSKIAAPTGDVLMIGDTTYDVLGAKAFGIPTLGVAWGYGNVAEMEAAGAAAVVSSPEELESYVENHFYSNK
jgi:phosphoglycolate phosphatase